MNKEDRILVHAAMENLAKSSLKAAESLSQVAKKCNELTKEIGRNDLFEKWLESLDIPLASWQKEVLRVACTQPDKQLYISMSRQNGRHLVMKLIEQYEQMIKGEKEMQKKLDKFDMKDIHSGYVVKFRNGKLALCMRVGEKFTKIFACLDEESKKDGAIEGGTFTYAARYKDNTSYRYNPIGRQYEKYPDFDIIEVYGLIEGVCNYLNAGDVGPISIKNRPVLWEETRKMTLEEIEKALGFKVEIVGDISTRHIKRADTCCRCRFYFTNDCSEYKGCEGCPNRIIFNNSSKCRCDTIESGKACPYFEEA